MLILRCILVFWISIRTCLHDFMLKKTQNLFTNTGCDSAPLFTLHLKSSVKAVVFFHRFRDF